MKLLIILLTMFLTQEHTVTVDFSQTGGEPARYEIVTFQGHGNYRFDSRQSAVQSLSIPDGDYTVKYQLFHWSTNCAHTLWSDSTPVAVVETYYGEKTAYGQTAVSSDKTYYTAINCNQ